MNRICIPLREKTSNGAFNALSNLEKNKMSEIFHQSMIGGLKQTIAPGKSLSTKNRQSANQCKDGVAESRQSMTGGSLETDFIELRLDYIKRPNLSLLLSRRSKKPIIATNRKKSEGGHFEGSEEERIGILEEAICRGVEYADIELSSGIDRIRELIKRKNKTKIIVSYHNFKETPVTSELNKIYSDIRKLNPDIIKMVTYANSINDNFGIFGLIKKAKRERKSVIAFCMGEYGQASRILTTAYGGFLTFAVLDNEKVTAPGQLSINELNSYNFKSLNPKTKILGLVGNIVKHSRVPLIFNSAFRKLNLDYSYLRFLIEDEKELKAFIENFREMGNFHGLGITIPYKEAVMKYLEQIEPAARGICAVNTVAKKNGRLIGYNTDYLGAIKALKEKTGIKNKKVVILGAGGAAKAVAYGVKKEKGKITILNRTVSKAEEIAKRLDCEYGGLDELKKRDYDILINCTSVGLKEGEMPVEPCFLKNVVMDAVYSKTEKEGKTKFLKEAEKKGCITVSGLKMLLYQAEEQARIWTGRNIDLK